jgi:hypothetical protein
MTDQKPTPPIVFLDTETTSLDRVMRFPWEIGLIRRDPDGTEVETVFQVDAYADTLMPGWPQAPIATADPMSLKIGRFHERYGTNPDIRVVPASEAGQLVEQWTRGALLVGAVPSFDEETLWKLVRGAQRTPTWHYHLVDVETLAAGSLGLTPPWNFDRVLAEFGLVYDEADRHTALGDARMARDLYDAVLAGPEPINADDLVDAPRPDVTAETAVA